MKHEIQRAKKYPSMHLVVVVLSCLVLISINHQRFPCVSSTEKKDKTTKTDLASIFSAK